MGISLFFLQLLVESIHEISRRIEPARAQQLVPRRYLDERRQISTGRHRHAHERHLHTEQLVHGLVETETVVFSMPVPAFELHNELDTFRRTRSRHTEQIPDVDYA